MLKIFKVAQEEGKKEGIEEGIEIGMEKGIEKGKEEGKGLGMAALIEMQLVSKFKSIPDEYSEKLKDLSEAKLRVIGSKVLEMEDIEELEDYLN